ncbi:hypothetical protein SNE40_008713 [Patella caerulea]|uniref:PIF1/LRR1 pleckstrin homology domain-containing protein n=1 Tax=Patella caerulea TaxID=87958 RepID=A0AAN8JPP3_PATCE
MRLTCSVEIVNRLLPSHNLKKPSQKSHSQISLGKKPGSTGKDGVLFLMICTAKDRNGTKIVVKDNIEQYFVKFINEGKATVRIKEPQHDICISKADPLQLKNFLNLLRSASQGKELERITLSALAPASARNVEKPKSKMVVLTRKDYPITTNFPSSLVHLQVSACNMKRVDSRILDLKKLQVLDLSENLIEDLPEKFNKMLQLNTVKFSHNKFMKFPLLLCRMPLSDNLVSVDLSDNQLTRIPLELCELKNLFYLKLDRNKIELLPPTIGKLVRLKQLSCVENLIKTLPANFNRLQLDDLDLYGNPLDLPEADTVITSHLEFPTLLEVSARAIKKMRIPYSNEDLFEQLCNYLDSARQCWCGNYCFRCSARYILRLDLHQMVKNVTGWNVVGQTLVPVEAFLCSQNCLNKFQKNPKAYWKKK